ncbi:ABC transporter permease [Candidatus Methylobacter favarea]|uniref:ABC transporter permease n=1 Tax=Candidatus Methylobacter favarea TaxID=2707345 RepID=A0A8S0YAS1_9GAMM|nr:efflux RND transporter periplasmic adaptor subunit [Candidatus Methylobacter favarea]CAA9892447.1 ABC transporter permease [Candidatus Methylobacter favarea]
MGFRHFTYFQLIVFISLNSVSLAGVAKIEHNSELDQNSLKAAVNPAMGVGALGRIEPRTRVIRVSHNAGAEGANLEKLLFREGDQVKNQDVLALLADHNKRKADIEVVKANMQVLESKLAVEKIILAYNEKEYLRYKTLIKTAAASISLADQKHLIFQQSQATIAQLRAEIASARADRRVAEENLAKTVIKAPIAGTILKIHTWPGERITDKGLLEMADLSQLDVVAEIYEADFPRVHIGQTAEIRIIGFPAPYAAEVRELGFQVRKNDLNDTDPLADKDNRIIEVRLTLEKQAVSDLQHQIYRQVQVRILP